EPAIAKGGADAFYAGEIAQAIAEDMKKNEALLSIEDLKAWKPERNAPLWGDYRGYKVSTNQPPGGGVMLIEMLNILENFDLAAMEHGSAEYLRVVSEAMKRATVDKDAHVGDPKFVNVPVERLTSKAYAREMAEEIKRGVKAEVPRFNSGAISKDTTHISVIDKDGNCFTMTHSLGMPSGVVTPGLGFMYNGCMGVFDPRPGRAGSIAPGKARFSSVVPSILFKDGKPHLIIGAPGATQIAMGVLHVILNALDFDMTMVEAVSAPRFSATSDTIDISNRIQGRVERELNAQGYPVVRSPYGFGFAAVHAIRIHEDGLDGGADPGHDGVVIAV
ncbi:MAG: gamma-glutamyltransferase, partial [Reyranella sp.]|uniref:gamma-glutamyltransferase family protein n=1 Tax=Reyranella sp. TaxID=1929291 RepID=UPI00121CF57B